MWQIEDYPYGNTGVRLVTSTTTASYGSIAAAIAVATSGDTVLVGPGTYAESFTIPDGVQVKGEQGDEFTFITGAAATGTRVTMGSGSSLSGFRVHLPTDATPAILHSSAGRSSLFNACFLGNGSLGIGIQNASGTLDMHHTHFESGTAGTLFSVTGGRIICRDHTVKDLTSIDTFVDVSNGFFGMNAVFLDGQSSITTACSVGANGNLLGASNQIVGCTTAIHITSSTANVSLRGFQVDNCIEDLLVDPGATPRVRIYGAQLRRDRVSYPYDATDVILFYVDDFEGDEGMLLHGELSVGRPQNPKESVFGQGDSYAIDVKTLTSDGTATSTTEGGNLTDVSAEASSASASTFTFQGTTANHTILFGSTLLNSDILKHCGIKLKQTVAAVEVVKRSFAFEIWNGAAWEEFRVMATHGDELYRYSNELFIRANTSEHIRYGVDLNTTWAKKTIDGSDLYWARVRITDNLTTAPVFEQLKLSPSRTEINGDGTLTHHGEARYKVDELTVGNVFGETGNVAEALVAVGSGGLPAGWTHSLPNALMNSEADAIYFQYQLAKGVDTSLPIYVRFVTTPELNPSTAVALTCSVLPVEVAGVFEADPTGGTVPVVRSSANCELLTDNAAQYDALTGLDFSVAAQATQTEFGPFYVDSYYEGDMVAIRLELEDDGSLSVDLAVWSAQVVSAQWTPGEHF